MHKVSEKYDQSAELDFQEDGVSAVADGLFACIENGNPEQLEQMRIYVQIPYRGTEYEGYEERARQAIGKPGEILVSEVDALKARAEKGCRFTPPLLAYKQEKQINLE